MNDYNLSHEDQLEHWKKYVHSIEEKEAKLKQKLNFKCEDIKLLEKELEQSVEKNTQYQRKLDTLQTKYDDLLMKQSSLARSNQSELSQLQEEKDFLSVQIQKLKKEKVDMEQENSLLIEKERIYKDALTKIEGELLTYKHNCEQLQNDLEHVKFLNEDTEKLLNQNASLLREIEMYKTKVLEYEIMLNVKKEIDTPKEGSSLSKSPIQSSLDGHSGSSTTALTKAKPVSALEKMMLMNSPSIPKSKLSKQM